MRPAAGSVTTGPLRVPLETTGDFRSVEEIDALLVEIPDLGLIRLGDVVDVTRETVEPAERPVLHDGAPAVLLAVQMEEGRDITAVGEELRAVTAGFEADQPLGVEARFATFQPDKVAASVYAALLNMGQTFAVVLAMMMLFLGWRSALVIASIVPFAVAFAFAGMGPLGVELQQVSIAAIIISLGLLVDSGLVVVEDMERRISDGAPREAAALAAGRQYAAPLAIASVTTVAAFLPPILLDGTEGQYGYSLGAVAALMLTGSFLCALYLLPRLAVWTLPEPRADARGRGLFDRLAGGYARLVRGVVRAPLLVVAACMGLVVPGAGQMGRVPARLFPLSERNQVLAYVDLPRGTDVAVTRDAASRLSDWLTDEEANPEVAGVTAFVGHGGPRFVLSLDPADTDPAAAFAIVDTTTFEASADVIERARAHVAAAFPEAEIRLKRLAMGGREPGVDVEIAGLDADRLLGAAQEVKAAFATAPGIVQNRDDWGAKRLTGQSRSRRAASASTA